MAKINKQEEEEELIDINLNMIKKDPETYESFKEQALLKGKSERDYMRDLLKSEENLITDSNIIFNLYMIEDLTKKEERIFRIIRDHEDDLDQAQLLYFYTLLKKYKPENLAKESASKHRQIFNKLINKVIDDPEDKIIQIADELRKEREKKADA